MTRFRFELDILWKVKEINAQIEREYQQEEITV
jgi:hypothetical protein